MERTDERDVSGPSGHHYNDVHVYDGKAHLGDAYHIERDSPIITLPYAAEAPFNSYHRQHDPSCLENTRVDLLQEICNWVEGSHGRHIFWLNGWAGMGKSTIARTVARQYYEQNRLGSFFFFSRGGGDIGHAGKFVTTIASQLTTRSSSLRDHICEAIREHGNISSLSLPDQGCHLVLQPLSKLDGNIRPSGYLLVVDALDECDEEEDIRIILQLLAEAQSLKTIPLQVFLTSRPDMSIGYGFSQMTEAAHHDFMVHNISLQKADHSIAIYLEFNLKLIALERALDPRWPGEEAISRMVQQAGRLVIWAATACRFVREGKRFAEKRLAVIRGTSSIIAPEKNLNDIYIMVLSSSNHPDYSDEEKEELFTMLRNVLGSIVVLFSTLSTRALGNLLLVSKRDVDETLTDLHAIIDVPEDQEHPVRLHYPSFRDFLLNKERCTDPNFVVDEKQAHRKLAYDCVRPMSTFLKQDICGWGQPDVCVTDIESSQVEQCLPTEVQYACLYLA